jgi:hypothetical protein
MPYKIFEMSTKGKPALPPALLDGLKIGLPHRRLSDKLPALMQNQSVTADDGKFIRGQFDWVSDH